MAGVKSYANLMEYFEQYPCLWDINDDLYGNKNARLCALYKVGYHFGTMIPKLIRDRIVAIIKKYKNNAIEDQDWIPYAHKYLGNVTDENLERVVRDLQSQPLTQTSSEVINWDDGGDDLLYDEYRKYPILFKFNPNKYAGKQEKTAAFFCITYDVGASVGGFDKEKTRNKIQSLLKGHWKTKYFDERPWDKKTVEFDLAMDKRYSEVNSKQRPDQNAYYDASQYLQTTLEETSYEASTSMNELDPGETVDKTDNFETGSAVTEDITENKPDTKPPQQVIESVNRDKTKKRKHSESDDNDVVIVSSSIPEVTTNSGNSEGNKKRKKAWESYFRTIQQKVVKLTEAQQDELMMKFQVVLSDYDR